MSARPTVVVTGVAGNLGQRLLPLLNDFDVVGIDMHLPADPSRFARFERLDLARESSCRALTSLLLETHAVAVVHLAFVIDPVRTGVLDTGHMWQINVAGTARVIEAISVANRSGGAVQKFIFLSSVSAYGPELPHPVSEDYPLGAHTLTYAIHKQEADDVVRLRASQMGACTTFILRPHIFVGGTMQNYLVGALRGTAGGKGRLGDWVRRKGKRLPFLVPSGDEYLVKRFQFVHVDDMARLLASILRRDTRNLKLIILNVAGRGDPISLQMAARIAGQQIVHLPSVRLCRWALALLWKLGISSVPPDALPYMIGSYVMDTSRLRAFLGPDYANVIRYTTEQALDETFHPVAEEARPLTTSATV
ncbi:MAG: NAD-dependent epimerase/dehydratase family protein [Terriglobales bacterium]